MKKLVLAAAAAALLMPALRPPAWAQPDDREGLESREQEHLMLSEDFLNLLKEKVKLKADQLKKAKSAIDEAREPLKRKAEEVGEANRRARELQKALRSLEMDLREKIRAGLTNEQKERFDEMVIRMRENLRPAKAPFGPKGELLDRPQFPPERWEENPDRGRRQQTP
ncbi:MAG TPA: hypothetical protein DCM05_13480 [Elusimicrobia bacterium]|nr:hypothetical protein [Elusimicrobiota bacterium]